jgi:sugar phosphate isomerase/epimerase
MNRLALHESAAAALDPADLVALAKEARFDSVGLRVAHTSRADHWVKGAAAPDLLEMIDRLLALRVSVLDVGRIDLGADDEPTQRGVLDLAGRLGARYVTVSAAADLSADEIAEQFAGLVARADAYQLVPLWAVRPGTAIDTTAAALAINRRVGGGTVLDVDLTVPAADIDEAVVDAGNHLGYLRLHAEQLDELAEDSAASLLATVPVHIPIAVGTAQPAPPTAGLERRARRWAALIDAMLEHPRSREHRLAAES